ncbi:TPA: sulfite exporter TauE/SafE family protein [Morganella morganii]|uniref:Probable membrane transporter protein n=1 Tax=Morganella morganii subsp. morganii KT TaxID=1124991 RepID=J7U3E9_MORMO|nr:MULTISPECIES: sulfite exporter TauE/SafE family protein [Morganella]AGG31669.1 Integral membrane protein [Morganella morganii subsp. morganii KT]AMG72295.2 sulfite exporter TauE/SafE family protein [Morganella morganii]AZP25179.1 sulfite exporter TauE/SafE family protein [Morganella morganii]EJK8625783.1 sulfite exporter TauE/SafE family protein [Morganella morganii]EKU4287735.1 sulfite exporter TauE/SafE family protein [Morganella morganii]
MQKQIACLLFIVWVTIMFSGAVPVFLLLFACGCIVGSTTVLFGFGGGFFIVPLLYALLTATADSHTAAAAMHIAVATSTGVMIFSASLATLRQHRAGMINWPQVRPLAGYIAAGAVAGALLAIAVQGIWVKWMFIAYLAITILDSIFRPGFMTQSASHLRTMPAGAVAVAGTVIGVVAAFLGVGGSVMTVPLMRRRGAEMAQATAMANPLSLPMALAGTLTYILLARHETAEFGSGFAGYVDIQAFMLLIAGSWLGQKLSAPLIGRIPDKLYAKSYLALLIFVLLVMVIVQ